MSKSQLEIINSIIGTEVSVADLVLAHEDLFYQQTASELTHPVFTEKRLINRGMIDAYTTAFKEDHLDWARSQNLHEDNIKHPTFPLLETLAWWIAYTRSLDHGHGMRSYVTASSTFIEGRRLGVAFLVNECLRISYTFQKHEVIYPAK